MFFLLVALAVDLPEECKVHNRPRFGWCRLACIDTAARVAGSKAAGIYTQQRLWGWQKQHQGTTDDMVKKHLDELGANYILSPMYTRDAELLKKYVPTHGACISFKRGTPWFATQQAHTVFITEFTALEVKIWDPNNPKQIFTKSRAFFDYYWLGDAVVMLGDDE